MQGRGDRRLNRRGVVVRQMRSLLRLIVDDGFKAKIRTAPGGPRQAECEACVVPTVPGRGGEGHNRQSVGPNERARLRHRLRLSARRLLLKNGREKPNALGEPPVARPNFPASTLNNRPLVLCSIRFIDFKTIHYKP